MEAYIKYKRIYGKFSSEALQTQFDELISGGWEIIYYQEGVESIAEQVNIYFDEENVKQQAPSTRVFKIPVTMVVGKKQNNIL